MPVRTLLPRMVVAGLLLASQSLASGQAPPPVDPAVVMAFAAAGTDAERAALLKSTPALTGLEWRFALGEHASALVRRRDYVAGDRAYLNLKWLGETMGNPSVVVTALIGLGSVQGQIGNLDEALALFHRAKAVADEKQNVPDMQAVANNLGIVHRRLGDYDAARASFDTALALAQQMKKDDAIARVYNNLGLLVQGQGNARQALEYYRLSLDLKVDDGGRGTQDIANTLNNIGGLYSDLGDYDQALTHYRKALALLEKLRLGSAVASALSNMGNALASIGQPKQAREAYERVLAMTEQSGDAGSKATVIYNLGTLARDEGNLEEAESLQRQSLAIREKGRDRIHLTESLAELASLLEARGRAEEAHGLAARAIELSGSAGLLAQLARAQVTQARILTALNQVDAATAMYEDAIRTVEELRGRTGGEQARQVFLSWRLAPYLGLAGLHAQAGRAAEALDVVEQARARTLLDILAEGRQPRRSMTADEQREERRLTNVVTTSALQLTAAQQGTDKARIAAMEKALRDARLAREAFVAALYVAQPDLRMARGDAPVLTRQQLARLITPGTAALEVVLDHEYVWLYLVTAGPDGPAVTARKLTMSATDLVAQAARFSTQVATRDLGFSSAARRLYDVLIGEVEPALAGVTRLIVVPDAVLWRLPFQALQSPRGTFLIEERSLSYAPSLSAVAALRERKARRTAGDPYLLALGDPALPASSAVPRLPEAAREVRELGRLYGAARSTVLVDAGATEHALRSSANSASVLHIATHGVMDDQNPMYSHLTLASPGHADAASDGRLEAWELLDMQLTADLAVLSACETANGRLGGGEGIIGLSWAMFAAGASTAVVSQWEVDSASTTALMIGFHEQLLGKGKATLTPSEALRASATALMKDPRYRHPFYWAGFIVIGS
jgi:CHAT domain-containing protein/Tfp pilus assembly protein PilF